MATGVDDDIKFVLGFANNEYMYMYVAHAAFDQHLQSERNDTSGSWIVV